MRYVIFSMSYWNLIFFLIVVISSPFVWYLLNVFMYHFLLWVFCVRYLIQNDEQNLIVKIVNAYNMLLYNYIDYSYMRANWLKLIHMVCALIWESQLYWHCITKMTHIQTTIMALLQQKEDLEMFQAWKCKQYYMAGYNKYKEIYLSEKGEYFQFESIID